MHLVATLLLACALTAGVVEASSSMYDKLCDRISSLTKKTTVADGVVGRETAFREVLAAYEASLRTPGGSENPKAALLVALYCTAVMDFPCATSYFDLAESRTKNAPESAMAQRVASTIRDGRANVRLLQLRQQRDEAYASGGGNISLARDLALELVQMPTSSGPSTATLLHDLGVMELMMCDARPAECRHALKHFAEAAAAAHRAFLAEGTSYVSDRMKRDPLCAGAAAVLAHDVPALLDRVGATSGTTPAATVAPLPHQQGWLLRLNVPTLVMGRDAVMAVGGLESVSPATSEVQSLACHLLMSSNTWLADVDANVLSHVDRKAHRRNNPRTLVPAEGKRVVSLLGFSGASYFQWMCVALPKLQLLLQYHKQDLQGAKLLLPTTPGGLPPRFVIASLGELVPSNLIAGFELHLHERMDTLAPNGLVTVLLPRDRNCVSADEDASKCAFNVAPRAALRATRDWIRGIFASPLRQTVGAPVERFENLPFTMPLTVVYCSRGSASSSMRHFDEASLLDSLRRVLPPHWELQEFDEPRSWDIEMALFARAAVVVGPHGGALANIMACRQGAHVIEIGFRSDAAKSYEHVAQHLGLEYRRVLTRPDERGVGAPILDFDASELLSAVQHSVGVIDTVMNRAIDEDL